MSYLCVRMLMNTVTKLNMSECMNISIYKVCFSVLFLLFPLSMLDSWKLDIMLSGLADLYPLAQALDHKEIVFADCAESLWL